LGFCLKHKRFIAPTLKFISTSHKSKVFGYKILSKLNSHIILSINGFNNGRI